MHHQIDTLFYLEPGVGMINDDQTDVGRVHLGLAVLGHLAVGEGHRSEEFAAVAEGGSDLVELALGVAALGLVAEAGERFVGLLHQARHVA